MDETIFLRFIANILSIHTLRIDREKDTLALFEKEFCFERTLQPMYTADYLSYLLEHTRPDTFYEITDYLNTNLLLFEFEDCHYLIGPYVKNTFAAEEMQELLATHKLPASILRSLKIYYTHFPQLSYNMVSETVQAAMRTFFPATPDYTLRKLTGFHEELKREELISESSKTYMQVIQRYEMENFFLQKISDGDVVGVRLAFDNIAKNFYATSDPIQQSIYFTDRNGFAVIRTLARKAAEQGGAHVVLIDEITQEGIQQFSRCRSLSDVEKCNRNLLLKLTRAVADAKSLREYSPAIRNVVSYLLFNYTQDISLSSLAASNHVSPEHLSRTFKKEVGETITEYITGLRLKKAAELLKNGNLLIAEIAMYVGYPDGNYFVKVFKKRYGMTPSAYRRNK